MSRRKHTSGTQNKRTCLSAVEQMQQERKALKAARKKFPNDSQKARVEAQLIMLGAMSRSGPTFGR